MTITLCRTAAEAWDDGYRTGAAEAQAAAEQARAAATLLLTVEEAAGQLRTSRSRIFALIGNGELPSVKIGSSRRIRVADLAAYVDTMPVAPPGR